MEGSLKNIRFFLIYISGFPLVTLIISLFLGIGSIVSGVSNPSINPSTNPPTPSTPNPQPTFLPLLVSDFPTWGRGRQEKPQFVVIEKAHGYWRYVDQNRVHLGDGRYGNVSRVIPLNLPIADGVVNYIDFYLQTDCSKEFNYSFYGAIVVTEGAPSVWRECNSLSSCSNVFFAPDQNAIKKIVEATCRS